MWKSYVNGRREKQHRVYVSATHLIFIEVSPETSILLSAAFGLHVKVKASHPGPLGVDIVLIKSSCCVEQTASVSKKPRALNLVVKPRWRQDGCSCGASMGI